MKVAILQPGFLPWLGFFDLLRRCDVFVYYDDVQYDKHGWRNRNRIKTQSGSKWLTVPIIHSNRTGQKLIEVEIDNSRDWQNKITRSLYQNYAKAPFIEKIFPEIEDSINKKWIKLVDLNYEIVNLMMGQFGLSRPIYYSSLLNVDGDKSGRLVNICKLFNANKYISGNAAQSYLDIQLFNDNGIEIEWQNYTHPEYPQLHGDFIPYLSALDYLMNVEQNVES